MNKDLDSFTNSKRRSGYVSVRDVPYGFRQIVRSSFPAGVVGAARSKMAAVLFVIFGDVIIDGLEDAEEVKRLAQHVDLSGIKSSSGDTGISDSKFDVILDSLHRIEAQLSLTKEAAGSASDSARSAELLCSYSLLDSQALVSGQANDPQSLALDGHLVRNLYASTRAMAKKLQNREREARFSAGNTPTQSENTSLDLAMG